MPLRYPLLAGTFFLLIQFGSSASAADSPQTVELIVDTSRAGEEIDLTRYALLTPVYWALMSVGAWMGLISHIHNPFYWAKTEHGVSLPRADASPALAIPQSDP